MEYLNASLREVNIYIGSDLNKCAGVVHRPVFSLLHLGVCGGTCPLFIADVLVQQVCAWCTRTAVLNHRVKLGSFPNTTQAGNEQEGRPVYHCLMQNYV